MSLSPANLSPTTGPGRTRHPGIPRPAAGRGLSQPPPVLLAVRRLQQARTSFRADSRRGQHQRRPSAMNISTAGLSAPSLEMAACSQNTIPNPPVPGTVPPRTPPTGRCPDTLHPVRAALLRKESELQDELGDMRQSIADAAAEGRPGPYAWPAGRVWLQEWKIRLYGFQPPKPATRPRPLSEAPLGARLHLRWIVLHEALRQWSMPTAYIYRGSCRGILWRLLLVVMGGGMIWENLPGNPPAADGSAHLTLLIAAYLRLAGGIIVFGLAVGYSLAMVRGVNRGGSK